MHQIFVNVYMNDIQRCPDDCLNWAKMALPQDLQFFYIIIIRNSKKNSLTDKFLPVLAYAFLEHLPLE